MPEYLSTKETAARLGISRQTLYAYVSRGMLQSLPSDIPRESRYLESEVEHLALKRRRGRKSKDVAKATLDWGFPVLESSISLIQDQHLYYRGLDAIALAQTMTLEDVSAHLWQMSKATAFKNNHPVESTGQVALSKLPPERFEQSILRDFTLISEDIGTAAWQRSPEQIAGGCGTLVRLLAACLLNSQPSAEPIHMQCAKKWNLDAEGADLIRMALVLCADHELNTSSFVARCVASTGASLRAAVIAGLAALTGTRHGGTTARGEALWEELGESQPIAKLHARLARGEDLPGFGHHVYPSGDPRAVALLSRVLPHHQKWQAFIDEGAKLVGARPSVDLALVALRRHLNLPVGAAFGLFALGRSAGWIAHAIEQRTMKDLIRPRAAYVGPTPIPS
ncbi:helix-turn-helix domain-containing protein [Pseudomonas sp. B6002]|nr:helix-turn-helix domain-containing protein [Pseudomonas sp. B6002]